jgi:phosphatidylethanolamine/phosphatidyl-N-methylethanolamine N-methyltransferase
MQKNAPLHSMIDHRVLFLQEFLRNPRQVGSITPSSRFLERRIVQLADIASARTIVELGAGTGGTTRAMLRAMSANARLLAMEINRQFCASLRRIDDARLVVHYGSADELHDVLSGLRMPAPDAIVSGIPFSTIDHVAGSRILEAIASVLAPGGRFVAYQLRKQVDTLSRPLLGPAHVELEPFNIPPIRLYRWQKVDGHAADRYSP